MYIAPAVQLSPLANHRTLSVNASVYAFCAYTFVQQFIKRLGGEYFALERILQDFRQKIHIEDAMKNRISVLMQTLRQRLLSGRYTPEFIWQEICKNHELVSLLYAHFAHKHLTPAQKNKYPNLVASLGPELDSAAVLDQISSKASDENVKHIFEMFVNFNDHIIKTNFHSEKKAAIAFRLNPQFLHSEEFPTRPFGIFLVLGVYFQAYHVRFRDIARGGIRLICSRDAAAYHYNRHTLFEENYNLAFTQQNKNKDIPEGGSKGAILLHLDKQGSEYYKTTAFKHYVDGLLDLLLSERHNSEEIAHIQEEVLFLGPDEGTADLMDWASSHAHQRGYIYWKAFTTGKSKGGIPHDRFGMTTRGVRAYVQGIYDKLKLDETTITKCQTGDAVDLLCHDNNTLARWTRWRLRKQRNPPFIGTHCCSSRWQWSLV